MQREQYRARASNLWWWLLRFRRVHRAGTTIPVKRLPHLLHRPAARIGTAWLLILALPILALTACGTGRLSKHDYETRAKAIGSKASARVNEMFAGKVVPSPQDFRETAKVVDDAADQLDDLKPPSDVAAPHSKVVAAMRKLSTWMVSIADALDAADSDAARKAVLTRFQNDPKARAAAVDFQGAAADFEKHGYTVFSSPREGEASSQVPTTSRPD